MSTVFTLPLQPVAQQFPIVLAGIAYQMTVRWNSNDASGVSSSSSSGSSGGTGVTGGIGGGSHIHTHGITTAENPDDDTVGTWIVDIYDGTGTSLIVGGIPFVTGTDLLAPFAYLGLGGQLVVQSSPLADTVPNFETLGSTGQLYYVVP